MKFRNQSESNRSSRRGRISIAAGMAVGLSILALGGAFATYAFTSGSTPSDDAVGNIYQSGESARDSFQSDEGTPPAVSLDAPATAPEQGMATYDDLVASADDAGELDETSLYSSSFNCSQGGGMIEFFLPYYASGDMHQFWFRVDGGEWLHTPWYYNGGFESRWEWNGYGWDRILSGMSFSLLHGTHTVEVYENRASIGWTNHGTCQTWDVNTVGPGEGECGPSHPGYYRDPTGLAWCAGY